MASPLSTVGRIALRHPYRMAAATLSALLALTALAPGVPLDLSFGALMDRSHPEVARYLEASQRHGLGGIVLALLEGPDAELDGALAAVHHALDGTEGIRSVDEIPAPGEPPTGLRLLRIVQLRDPLLSAIDADDFPRLRAAARLALEGGAVQARFAGMAAIVTEEQEATLARMRWLALVSLALVLLLLQRVERGAATLGSAGLVLVLAAGATLGIVGRASGELTLMESLFGVMIFGLGADFAIHWLLRAREERARGASVDEALLRSIRGTGRGNVAGALTSGGAFGLLMLSPEPVFQRLGVAGSIGLGLGVLGMLLVLPAVWAERERRRPSRPVALRTPLLERLSRASARAPVIVGLSCLAITISAVALQGRFHYETNLERVFSRDIEAVQVAHELRAAFGVDPQPWIATAATHAAAAQIAADFESTELFERAVIAPALDGGWLVQAFARELSLDSERAAEQRRVAQAVHPQATSMVALFEALIGTDRPWVPRLTAGVAFLVALVLLADLRSARLALIAIVPVTVGSLAAFAVLCAAGFAWNTVTLVGLPLLLGLGVDDGIHLAHRIREEPARPIDAIVGSVGPAIAVTTLTTCASVVTLLWSRHPGIESLAILLLVGLPACLIASVTALPAAGTALGVARVDPEAPSGE
jgi:predicted RND superfamily exporter protein